MRKIISFTVIIIILLISFLFVSELSRRRDNESYNDLIKDSKKREKSYKIELDSLKFAYEILEKHYKNVSEDYIKSKEAVDIANKRYEKIRNSKPTSYNDKQIDSILNRYYPRP